MVVKAETPISREKLSIKKKKNKKSKDITEPSKTEKPNVIAFNENIQQPTIEHSLLCIEGLKKVHKSKDKDNKKGNLFDDGERILLQVTGIKLPKDDRKHCMRISLPQCSIPDPRDVCLIVRDLEKGLKIDHESTLNHFNELLSEKGIDDITQVISLRELKVEYKQYEAKNSLCQKFDIFLVDDRILRLVPMFLGKSFYRRKRIPIPVNLRANDLKKEIAKAIKTVTLPLNHHGTCSMVQIGNTSMESSAIAENLIHVNAVLEKRYPGGWKNIRAQHIKTESSIAVPIYTNTLPTNDVGFVDADIPKKNKRESVTGELSTIPGIEVTVTPSGNIRVVKTADPEWDDEKDEAFVDASEDEQEDKPEEKETVDKKSKKRKKKKEENGKSKKSKKDDSDSEDDINDSEQKYMKKVAREDAEKPDTETDDAEENNEQEKNSEAVSDNDSEEENDNSNELEDSEGSEDEVESEDDSGAEAEENSDAEEEATDDDEEMEPAEEDTDEENKSLSDNDESDSEEPEAEKFDDQQEIDDKDIIVDSDDEEDDDIEIASMDKHLVKKMPQVVDDDEEDAEATKSKPKKRSKKERRVAIKQLKAAKAAKSKKKK